MSRLNKTLKLILLYSGLIALAIITLSPYLWLALSSFKTEGEIFQMPPTTLPEEPVTINYERALNLTAQEGRASPLIFPGLVNSFQIATISTCILLILSSLAGFAFARLTFPGRTFLLVSLLILRMLPGIVLAVPVFVMAANTKLLDTKLVLIITYVAFNAPFAVWLLSVFFQEVPRELEDAALVDGCTKFKLLRHIYIPLSLPAIATVGILVFLSMWNEFLFGVLLTSTTAAKTAPVALASLISARDTRWGIMTAGGVLQTLPSLVVVIFAQRFIIKGLTFGAVKG